MSLLNRLSRGIVETKLSEGGLASANDAADVAEGEAVSIAVEGEEEPELSVMWILR